MGLPSGEKTVTVTEKGEMECAVTVNSYTLGSDTYNVTVEGRIRNVGKTRATHNTANISCSISGQQNVSGANFGFDLAPGDVLTFISKNFNITQTDIGNNGLDFTVHYGTTGTSAFGDNHSVRYVLAVRPAQPGPPQFTNITPISVTVFWDASINTGGSPITSYKLRRWLDAPGHGDFLDNDGNSTFRNLTGLIPGQTYGFAVYAKNGSDDNDGFSDGSTGETILMPSGAWVRVNNAWYIAIPYVRSGGRWKLAEAHVRSGGTWHVTS